MSYADEVIAGLIATASGVGGALASYSLTAATVKEPPFDGNIISAPDIDDAEGCPSKAIFCTQLTGSEDARLLGSTVRHRVENVEVTIRGEPYQYDTTRKMAYDIREVLHYATVSGYYSVQCIENAPGYVGRDDKMRHTFLISIELRSVR